jgi:hypothetical protein
MNSIPQDDNSHVVVPKRTKTHEGVPMEQILETSHPLGDITTWDTTRIVTFTDFRILIKMKPQYHSRSDITENQHAVEIIQIP